MWRWPLPGCSVPVPTTEQGAFAAVRTHDTHTGVDLYCDVGQTVTAVEDGQVVAVTQFTGGAESPWWNDTWAVMVEGASGVVTYGEITPLVQEGVVVRAGDPVGTVLRVLKKDKGRPTSMLHLELYTHGTRAHPWWRGDTQPPELLDPTDALLRCHPSGH